MPVHRRLCNTVCVTKSALEERLEKLRREFIEGLPARAVELEAWVADESLGSDVVGRLCHRLRGVAPSHGLLELGALAAEVDDRAKAGASRAELVGPARLLVSALRSADDPRASIPPGATRQLEGLVIVAIDDDPFMRKLLRLTLVDMGGANATIVSAPTAFLDELARVSADVVLVDVMMPTTSGPALLDRAIAEGLLRDTPVIILSAADRDHPSTPTIPRPWTWVSKPFRPVDLLDAIALTAEPRR